MSVNLKAWKSVDGEVVYIQESEAGEGILGPNYTRLPALDRVISNDFLTFEDFATQSSQTIQDSAISLNTAKVSFPEAPNDGQQYARQGLGWTLVNDSGDFSNGGDTAAANRTLGNNDAFALGLETSGIERIHIASDGDIGFGTTTPLARFHAVGDSPTQEVFRVQGVVGQVSPFMDIRDGAGIDLMSLEASGQLYLDNYGSGTFVGPFEYLLGINASGHVVEHKLRNNYLAAGIDIGSASNAANQNFQIDLSVAGIDIGDTIRLGNSLVRGDLSGDGSEYIDVGFGSTADPKARLGDTGYDDLAIFRTDGSLIDRTYTVVDIGGGTAGLQVYVSPAVAVNFPPTGMPNGWWWQFKIDILVV